MDHRWCGQGGLRTPLDAGLEADSLQSFSGCCAAIGGASAVTIHVIVPDLGNPFSWQPLFPAVLRGVQLRARQADHAVFLADSDEDPRLEADLIQAMVKQVDGVVVCSSRMELAELRQVAEHLAALGHRRCAFLAGPRNSWSNRDGSSSPA